jgi:hypothetical protein
MENVVIECRTCGEDFIFSSSEQSFYRNKGFESPKRCKKCRDNDISRGLNYKKSSIIDHWSVFGIGSGVEGGLDIEHVYLVKCIQQGEVKYLFRKNENPQLTKNRKEATLFNRQSAKEYVELLSRNVEITNVTLVPYARYVNRSIGVSKKEN